MVGGLIERPLPVSARSASYLLAFNCAGRGLTAYPPSLAAHPDGHRRGVGVGATKCCSTQRTRSHPARSSSTVKRVSQPLRALDRPVRRVLPAVRILRSPSSGLLARGVRYGLAGAAVALVYLSTTTVLAEVVRIPFQIALAIGFSVALIVHFTLKRLLYGAIRRSSRCLCITRSVAILRLPERSTA